jgi:hypothetical protein
MEAIVFCCAMNRKVVEAGNRPLNLSIVNWD